jgi:hypothetical protein
MTITIDVRRPAVTVTAALLMASLGAVAYATIPDADGQLHGCYHKNDGGVEADRSCEGELPSSGGKSDCLGAGNRWSSSQRPSRHAAHR